MYPQRELTRLAVHKAALRRDIALRRTECVTAAAGLAQPIAWLDRGIAFLRRFASMARLAAVPLGFLLTRAAFPRLKTLGALAKWAPLIFSAVRAAGFGRSSAVDAARSSRGRR